MKKDLGGTPKTGIVLRYEAENDADSRELESLLDAVNHIGVLIGTEHANGKLTLVKISVSYSSLTDPFVRNQ